MAHHKDYPYNVEEFAGDLVRWQAATKVAPARQGPLASLQLGGAARSVVDRIHISILMNGMVCDLNDGQGNTQHTGIEMLLAALYTEFPTDPEAQMFRIGMEFFQFCPRHGETLRTLMQRFDELLRRANTPWNSAFLTRVVPGCCCLFLS